MLKSVWKCIESIRIKKWVTNFQIMRANFGGGSGRVDQKPTFWVFFTTSLSFLYIKCKKYYWFLLYQLFENLTHPSTVQWKNATENKIFVIVLFIIGHTRNRAQGTPKKKAENRISKQTPNRFYVENPTGTKGSSVERMAGGERGPRSCILPAEWRPCPLIPLQEDPSTRPCLTSMKSKTRTTTGL